MRPDDVLTTALDLAARGMHAFPVDSPELERCAGIGRDHYPATCTERGKHPCVPFTKRATTDQRQIAAWFAGTTRNLGIACGPSGLVVIDEDTPGDLARYATTVGGVVPDTFTVTTGRGSHYYFTAPADLDLGNTEHKLKPYGVNVRGRGGYVVGPGSLHATGALYSIDRDTAPGEMPEWLLDALRPPRVVEGFDWSIGQDKPRGLAAVPEVIAGPREGHGGERHEVLVRYACSLRGRDVPLTEAEPLFQLVWQRCQQPPACGSPLPWSEARGKLLDVYERYAVTSPRPEPVTVLDSTEAVLDVAHTLAVEVEREAYKIRVREAARDKVAAERSQSAPGFDAGTLAEILARPADPPARVEGLVPSGASTLIVAQRKTGKTTLILGLARCLLQGGDFLGRFPTRSIAGRVAILNYEVTGSMLGGWADQVGVPRDRLVLVNLRGRRNPLRVPEDRAKLAEYLRGLDVEVLVVDPFGRAYGGKSQNDAAEVGGWLVDLDTFSRAEVGAAEVYLTAHAGWTAERTRGSSALEDWPDVTITLTRDKDDQTVRYLAAEGRDVLLEEDRLDFDPVTRELTLSGAGSRKQARASQHHAELVGAVVEVVTTSPGINTSGIETVLREGGHGFQRGDVGKAGRAATAAGLLRQEHGPRNSVLWSSTASVLPSTPEVLPAGVVSAPDPSYKGREHSTTTRPLSAPEPQSPVEMELGHHLLTACPDCGDDLAGPPGDRCSCPAEHGEVA